MVAPPGRRCRRSRGTGCSRSWGSCRCRSGSGWWSPRASCQLCPSAACQGPADVAHRVIECCLQELTLVHFSAQRKLILWDTLGASVSPGLLDRETREGVTKTAEPELKSGRVQLLVVHLYKRGIRIRLTTRRAIGVRPHHRYLFMRSPWRFSSAVHLRVHMAHALSSAPVRSLVPSSQGLTLVHFSAQLERLSCDGGCA